MHSPGPHEVKEELIEKALQEALAERPDARAHGGDVAVTPPTDEQPPATEDNEQAMAALLLAEIKRGRRAR